MVATTTTVATTTNANAGEEEQQRGGRKGWKGGSLLARKERLLFVRPYSVSEMSASAWDNDESDNGDEREDDERERRKRLGQKANGDDKDAGPRRTRSTAAASTKGRERKQNAAACRRGRTNCCRCSRTPVSELSLGDSSDLRAGNDGGDDNKGGVNDRVDGAKGDKPAYTGRSGKGGSCGPLRDAGTSCSRYSPTPCRR